ncbi:MAG: hypothetical protein R6X13_02995 [bacterium]
MIKHKDTKSTSDCRSTIVDCRLARVLCVLCVFVVIALAQDSVPATDSAAQQPQLHIVSGGPVSVAAKLKPQRGKLTVGDPFGVELVVRRLRTVSASQPFLPEPGQFLVLDRKTVTSYAGDTIVDRHTLKMAAFAPGELKLPPFIVTWQGDTSVYASSSDSLPVTIASVMPDSMKDINDLKPQVQYPNLLPIWILLGLIALIGLAWLGRRLYRRYRRIKLYGAALPDPWDEARNALERVPVKEWLEAGQVKRYYYTLSEILKRYLTRRFGFPALDQTTTEIARAMKAAKTPERDGFGEFFRAADMVKYAKYLPPKSDATAAIERARELVTLTTPKTEDKPETRSSNDETGSANRQSDIVDRKSP